MAGALLLAGALAAVVVVLARRGSVSAAEPSDVGADVGPGAVELVTRDLLLEAGSWRAVEARPEHPPAVSLLLPSYAKLSTGGERPALVMPPPCRVAFEVGPESDVTVEPVCGVGYRFRPPRGAGGEPVRVRFRVEVDGETVRSAEVECADDVDDAARDWAGLGEPLRLRPGARVELVTELDVPDGVELAPRVAAGFAELGLRRRYERVRRTATPAEPNVVLIVMDTLRQDAVGAYGGEGRSATPHVDALAARGALFETAYATASWTWPSTASILTGLEPDEHGLLDNRASYLNTGLETVAEALFARDYATAAFSCNPLVNHDKRFDQGFEAFDDDGGFRYGDEVVPRVLEWLERHAGSRFFLYLHLVDPHIPYSLAPEFAAELERLPAEPMSKVEKRILAGEGRAPDGTIDLDAVAPPAEREAMRAQYRAAVRTADLWIGRVLERLRELGLDDTTLVAFTSDHGEELWDHGLATHGHQLHEELVRVPLILAGPGVPAGARVASPVSNRHLAPTLAAAGGAPFERPSDPRDLVELARGGDDGPHAVAFSTHNGRWDRGETVTSIFGLRDGEWVLHYAPRPEGAGTEDATGAGAVRLFHLGEDPRQLDDRAAREPARAEALREHLVEHLRATGARRTATAVGAGSQTMKLLRDIGYVDSEE